MKPGDKIAYRTKSSTEDSHGTLKAITADRIEITVPPLRAIWPIAWHEIVKIEVVDPKG